MKNRRSVTVVGIITAVLLCGLVSGFSYLTLTQPIYPNATPLSAIERTCQTKARAISCTRTARFHTNDSAETVKAHFSKSATRINPSSKMSQVVMPGFRHSFYVNILGVRSIYIDHRQYIYVQTDENEAKLTHNTHTNIGYFGKPLDDWITYP